MTPESMDSLFQALGHAARRRMLDIVKASPGCSVNDVADQFPISRIAVMKHLRVLEEAGLLRSEKHGRTRQLRFNAAPIQMIYDRWKTEFSRYWASRLTRIKYAVEDHNSEDQDQSQSGDPSDGGH
jgi:DNA-binding transcriptional ArsR family regulator